jgi:hypothetical protein
MKIRTSEFSTKCRDSRELLPALAFARNVRRQASIFARSVYWRPSFFHLLRRSLFQAGEQLGERDFKGLGDFESVSAHRSHPIGIRKLIAMRAKE